MSSANALLRQKAQEGRRATADPGECHSRPRERERGSRHMVPSVSKRDL